MNSNLDTSAADTDAVGQTPQLIRGSGPTVFFDGACPLCRREIGFYQRRHSLSDVSWVDVSDCSQSDLPNGLTREQVLARFHVILPDDSVHSGPRGFGVIWTRMKGFSWLGKMLQLDGLQPVLELLYRGFLIVRSKTVQRMSRC